VYLKGLQLKKDFAGVATPVPEKLFKNFHKGGRKIIASWFENLTEKKEGTWKGITI